MALVCCILGKFLGVVCHCFPLYLYIIPKRLANVSLFLCKSGGFCSVCFEGSCLTGCYTDRRAFATLLQSITTQTTWILSVSLRCFLMSVHKWQDVKCSDVEWADMNRVKWFCFEVKWSELTVKFLGTKVPCALGWLFCLSHFFQYYAGFSLYHCINGCMFCTLVFNFLNYVFLLLCCVFLFGVCGSVHLGNIYV
jgi:hypothetical protein